MLYVIVLRHSVCRGSDAVFIEGGFRLVFKCDDVRHTCGQFVWSAYAGNTAQIVDVGFVIEIVQVAAFQGDTVSVVEVARFASVAERILYAFHVHVHFRLIAVLVPHALSFGVLWQCLLRDVSVGVIFVVGHGCSVAQLLRYLRQVVRIVRVIGGRYIVIYRSVSAGYGHVHGQAEDVLGTVGGVLDGSLVVEAAVPVLTECAFVTVLVRFQLAVVAGQIVFVPCFRSDHAVSRTFILQVGRVAQRYERRCTVAAQVALCRKGVVVTVGCQVVAVVFVLGFGVLVACCILYGSIGQVPLYIIVGHVVFFHGLTVQRIALFRVEVLGYYLTESEELTFMAVTPTIAVFECGGHCRSVIADTVVHCQFRHYPFTARQSVGRVCMLIVEGKGSSQ